MARAEIPFGEWLPDAPDLKNPGCIVAENVIPTTGGYGPFPSFVPTTDTATERVQGADQMFDGDGESVVVGGSATRLFVRRSSLSETTGYTNIGPTEAWDFAQFNDFVFATSENNAPQYLSDIDTDNTWSAAPGSPPSAKRCARVSDFLVLGAIAGAPTRIYWSAVNNPTGSWTASRLTQAGFADLDTRLGPVQRVIGGRYGIVLQERGIQRLSYVGPPLVFRVDPVSKDRGTTAPFSAVTVGYITYFLAQDGFYMTNGSEVQPIGAARVNRWFFSEVSQDRINETHGAVDWQNESIIWAFKSVGAGDTFNRFLIYSWAQQRWSYAVEDVDWIVASVQDGLSLDDFDPIYPSLDAVPVTLDSDQFKDGERRLGAFIDRTYGTYSGLPMDARWVTGQWQPSPSQRTHVSEVWPLVEGDTRDEEAVGRFEENDGTQTATQAIGVAWGGFCPVLGEGSKVSIELLKRGGTNWQNAQGIQIDYKPGGYR